MVYFLFLACIFIGSYTLFNLLIYKAWLAIPNFKAVSGQSNSTFITVVIPVRNEEKYILNILKDIEDQDYSSQLFEVYIVNDCSTDNTALIVSNFIKTCNTSIQIINLSENTVYKSPKKTAISMVVGLAKGDLILSTDGDCRLSKTWLTDFATQYEFTKHKIISGPVTFFEKTSIFNAMQLVEFSSLIGVGAASIQLSMPNMCNGANLAFEKSAFLAVDGYQGFEDQPSGDDEFLLHKIAHKFPDEISFLKSKNAVVSTQAQGSFRTFVNQRVRWASKWSAYKDVKVSILAIFVFLVNLLTCISIILVCLQPLNYFLMALLLLRFLVEILFLSNVLIFLDRKSTILFIPLVQFFYSFYVVFIAIISQFNVYEWKGRTYKAK